LYFGIATNRREIETSDHPMGPMSSFESEIREREMEIASEACEVILYRQRPTKETHSVNTTLVICLRVARVFQ
jgi:hypothetical protein